MRSLISKGLVLAILAMPTYLIAPTAAQAAESYDNCTGYIDALPTTIDANGTWCLRADLTTSLATGAAITIAASYATLDCNGHMVIGPGAGSGTSATGIEVTATPVATRATIRNCKVSSFYRGIRTLGTQGMHLIENNVVDQSTVAGIVIGGGTENLVRNNRISMVGTGNGSAYGLYGYADMIGNTVDTVMGFYSYGVYALGDGLHLAGNRIRGIQANARGIYATGQGVDISDNWINIIGSSLDSTSYGVHASGDATFCTNNKVRVGTFGSNALVGCEKYSGNLASD